MALSARTSFRLASLCSARAAVLGAAALVLASTSQGEITIRYMSSNGVDTVKVIAPLIAKYEREHPGVRIQLDRVPEQKERKLLVQYAARTAPDVFEASVNSYRMFAYRNVFWTVDELSAKFGITYPLKRAYQNVLDIYRYNGKLWALPSSVNSPMLVYYNRKHFREAGIPYPDGTWTYDTHMRPELKEKDFVWVMDRLTHRGSASSRRWGFAPAWSQLLANSLFVTSDVKMWDRDDHPTKLLFDQPRMVELMQFAADWVQKKQWVPADSEVSKGMGSSMKNEFILGRISMYQSGAWEILTLQKDGPAHNLDWEVTTFPSYAGRPFKAFAEGNAIGVVRSTQHPKEAWEFAQFIAGEDLQTAVAKVGENQPVFRDLAVKPGIWEPTPEEAKLRPPRTLAATDKLARAMTPLLTPEYFQPIINNIYGSFYGILSENQPAKQALHKLQVDESARLKIQLRRTEISPFPWIPAIAAAFLGFMGLLWWIYQPFSGPPTTGREKRAFRVAHLFLVPWMIGMLLTLGPIAYSLMLSFSDSDIIRPPNWVGLQNYSDAFSGLDPNFYRSVIVTGYYTILSIPLGLAASLVLSLLLNTKVKGIALYRAFFYLPSLASGVAMSLIWMRVFHPEIGLINRLLYGQDGKGWIGNWLSDVLGVHGQQINWLLNEKTVMPAFITMGLWGAGGGTIILLAGLQNISPQYYEASLLDGAGPLRQFRSITLPLLSPTLFFSLVTGLIGSFQVFTQAFVITDGGPNGATTFYMLNLYKEAFLNLRMGYSSALAWILFVIILAFTALQLWGSKFWVFYEGDAR